MKTIVACLSACWLATTVDLGLGADKPAGSAAPALATLFEEDFKTTEAVNRFRQLTNGERRFDLAAGKMTVQKGVELVRPVPQAGPVVRLTAKLEFAPLKQDGDETQTALGFVLANQQLALVEVARRQADGKGTAEVRITRAVENRPQPAVLRTFSVAADACDGTWTFEYHNGRFVVQRDKALVGRGYLETPDVVVLGVVWRQASGSTTCGGMRLDGVTRPGPRPAGEEQLLQKAAQLNRDGMRLYQEGKVAEALAPTKAASDLYLKVLGEKHHDTANSFSNVATLLEKQQAYAEAKTFYERAHAVRRELFGPRHPHTALVVFNLGNLMMKQDKRAEARPYYAECLAVYAEVFGEDHKLTRDLTQLVSKLPAGEKP